MRSIDQFGAVPLTFLRADRAQRTDWQPSGVAVTHHFPGGNRTETQVMGRGVLRWTLLARFDDEAAFARFHALYLTRATMRVAHRASVFPGDREYDVAGDLCREWDDVFLADISEVRGQSAKVYCTATFERAVPA